MEKIIPCVWKYILPGTLDIDCPHIHMCQQIDFSYKYKIIYHGQCLNKNGNLEFEPMPSSRDDEFMERCRFDTLEDAYNILNKAILEEL